MAFLWDYYGSSFSQMCVVTRELMNTEEKGLLNMGLAHLGWNGHFREGVSGHGTCGHKNSADTDVVDVVVRGFDAQELEEALDHVVELDSLDVRSVPGYVSNIYEKSDSILAASTGQFRPGRDC
jgi:hypothetical protein